MGRNLKIPWSIQDTIENMEYIRSLMVNQVRMVNLDGKGEEDVKEIHFDFNRVEEALEKQIPLKPQEVLLANGKGYECKNCGNELSVSEFDGVYCHWCGQKLDW